MRSVKKWIPLGKKLKFGHKEREEDGLLPNAEGPQMRMIVASAAFS
jgi:hypothetical protein